MSDLIAAARARIARSTEPSEELDELRATLRALDIATAFSDQYRSDRDALRREVNALVAENRLLRADLGMLKRAPRGRPVNYR